MNFPKKNEAKLFNIKNKNGEYLRINRDGQAFWVELERKATTFHYRYWNETSKKLVANGLKLDELIYDTDLESGWAF